MTLESGMEFVNGPKREDFLEALYGRTVHYFTLSSGEKIGIDIRTISFGKNKSLQIMGMSTVGNNTIGFRYNPDDTTGKVDFVH